MRGRAPWAAGIASLLIVLMAISADHAHAVNGENRALGALPFFFAVAAILLVVVLARRIGSTFLILLLVGAAVVVALVFYVFAVGFATI